MLGLHIEPVTFCDPFKQLYALACTMMVGNTWRMLYLVSRFRVHLHVRPRIGQARAYITSPTFSTLIKALISWKRKVGHQATLRIIA